jgi:peptidoglycan/xylan/chitin deacetylase (PgdA/CDA1 family)
MHRILNLHEVRDFRWFDKLASYLKSRYNMVSLDSIENFYGTDMDLKNACHITVDDGEKSFYEVIYPVLKKHKIPATLFVSPKIITERSNYWFQEIKGYNSNELKKSISSVTGISFNLLKNYNEVWILKTLKINEIQEIIKTYQSTTKTIPKISQNITIENLKEISESGLITLGAHSLNHPILINEDNKNCEIEISSSINDLSAIIKKKVKYFAYPNGTQNLDFSFREEKILSLNGIQLALTTEAGNLSLSDNKFRIPRLGIAENQNMLVIKSKLFLGSQWKILKKMKPTEEHQQRRKITRLSTFSSNTLSNR